MQRRFPNLLCRRLSPFAACQSAASARRRPSRPAAALLEALAGLETRDTADLSASASLRRDRAEAAGEGGEVCATNGAFVPWPLSAAACGTSAESPAYRLRLSRRRRPRRHVRR